jgi:chemotaxis response regulator CheB
MQRIRVLLVQVPGVLCGILGDIVGREPDMEIVGELSGYDELMPALRRTEPHFVIWGLEPAGADGIGAVPDACRAVLDGYPRIKVLAVEGDGRSGSLYGLRPWRRELGELGPARIVEVLRGADPRLTAATAS